MSHVVTIQFPIKDLDALERACKLLGLELVRGQQTYKWWGRSVGDYPIPQGLTAADLGKCQHAIRVAGDTSAYEAGVCQTANGYTLLWDFYGTDGRKLQDRLGKDALKLQDAYNAEIAVRHYQKQGFRVSRSVKEDGRIVLTASR